MEFFFQPIHTDYAYFENKNHINIFCSENWAERIHGWFTFNSIFDVPFLHPRWLPLLLAKISNGLRKESSEIVLCHLEVKLKIKRAITCSWMSIPFQCNFWQMLIIMSYLWVNTENEHSFMEEKLNGAHIPKLGHGELLPSLVRRAQ